MPTMQHQKKTDLYPSRVKELPEILPRLDPVVYGATDAEGPLTTEQLEQYRQQGFWAVTGFLPDNEVQACQTELDRLRESADVKAREEAIVEPDSDELRSLFAVHRIVPFFERLSADARLVSIARQILGSDVYIHQSRINLKPGYRGREFYWHSDFETWHVEDGMPRMRAVSFSMAMTANYACNGPLMLIPGSHHKYVACVGKTPENHYQRSLRKQDIGVPDDDSLRLLAELGGIEAPTGPAGTLVIFDCNTMHGSGGNISPFPRNNVFLVYNSVENRLHAPYHGLSPRPEFIATRG